LLSIAAFSFPKEYSVVVNKANPILEMAAKDLQKIFLGDKTTWADGNQIKVAALNTGDLSSEFTREFIKMTVVQFATHWKQKVFSGSGAGTDIKFFKTEQKLKEYIISTPEAIGYIYTDMLDDSVKQVKIIKE
jgi:ABC-type phosphate transport system substrate-binding protein